MITIPTIAQIRDQIVADIEGKIGQTVPSLPKAFFRVVATALAGVLSLVYRFGGWIYDQIFAQTSDGEALTRRGEEIGVYRTPAVAAVLTAQVSGENDVIIPAGTTWQYNGTVYQQTVSALIIGGVSIITIECLTPGGVGNLIIGSVLSIVTPLAGVDSAATVTGATTGGEDEETDDNYRTRILTRLSQRPQGGATPDYISWALEVPGIVKAFAFRSGPGEVTVYPLQALTGSRIPDASKLSEVQAYLQDTRRRPLCANVLASAMAERTISVEVTAVGPDTADMRLAIESAWDSYFLRAFPRQYEDEAAQTNIVSLAALYSEAIGAGAYSITATMTIDGVPGAIEAYTLLEDEIIKLDGVTWPV